MFNGTIRSRLYRRPPSWSLRLRWLTQGRRRDSTQADAAVAASTRQGCALAHRVARRRPRRRPAVVAEAGRPSPVERAEAPQQALLDASLETVDVEVVAALAGQEKVPLQLLPTQRGDLRLAGDVRTSAGAAHREREVALPLRAVARHEEGGELHDPVEEPLVAAGIASHQIGKTKTRRSASNSRRW